MGLYKYCTLVRMYYLNKKINDGKLTSCGNDRQHGIITTHAENDGGLSVSMMLRL